MRISICVLLRAHGLLRSQHPSLKFVTWAQVRQRQPGDIRWLSASPIWRNDTTKSNEPSARDAITEANILTRANAFGLTSIDRLMAESAVGHTDNLGSRLVDQPGWRHNFDLWCVLLDFRRLRFGDEGVRAIFRGLRDRCGKGFPFKGPQADHLWAAFIDAELESPGRRLERLCTFEISSGSLRPTFFVDVVGKLLQSKRPAFASRMATKLRGHHIVNHHDLLTIVLCAFKSRYAGALNECCNVLSLFPGMKMYDAIISHLGEATDYEVETWAMHNFLIAQGDLPQDIQTLVPLVQRLAKRGTGLESFLRSLDKAGASFEAQIRRLYNQERARLTGVSLDNLNIVSSRTLGMRPRTISDEFAARAFATKSLSFDFMLGGLQLLGLISMGPLSIREIALGAGGPTELKRRFARLHEAGVDTGSSVYARVVRGLAAEGQTSLLRAVLESDQHPDVFEDGSTQMKLLDQYLRLQDWPQVNRTLIILNGGTLAGHKPTDSTNLFLRQALNSRDWPASSQMLGRLLIRGQRLEDATSTRLRCLMQSSRHNLDALNQVLFFIAATQATLNTGKHIDIEIWREPLRQLGKLGRWAELEKTVRWIASWYSGHDHAGPRNKSSLNVLFDAPMQRAIVSWAFIHAAERVISLPRDSMLGKRSLRNHEPWLRGIRLLQRLVDEHNVQMGEAAILRALMLRLNVLFSTNGYSKLLRNRRLRSWNSASLQHYLVAFYREWKRPLRQNERVRLLRGALATSKSRPRDLIRLRINWLWEQNQRRRKMKLSGPAVAYAAAPEKEEPPVPGVEPAEEQVVMYQDLYHPSWKEYKR